MAIVPIRNLGGGSSGGGITMDSNIIFDSGNVNKKIWGELSADGWTDGETANALESGTIENNVLKVQGKSTTDVVMGTHKPVDLTQYSTLHVNVATMGTNNGSLVVVVSPTKELYTNRYTYQQYSNTTGEKTISVSGITSNAYVAVFARNDTARYATISKIWFT